MKPVNLMYLAAISESAEQYNMRRIHLITRNHAGLY